MRMWLHYRSGNTTGQSNPRLRQAADIRTIPSLSSPEATSDSPLFPEGITESEHLAIVSEVDKLMIGPSAEEFKKPKRRSGFALIAVANLVFIMAAGAAVFLYIRFVPRSAPDVDIFTGQIGTAESAIISQLQQQSAETLSEREARIAEIQRELAELQRQSIGGGSEASNARQLELEQALANLNASASERLAALEGSTARVRFLSDQLATVYGNIRQAVRDGRYETARALVADAENLIAREAVFSSTELALPSQAVAAANRVLAEVLPLAADDASQLALLASRINEIDSLVDQADQRLVEGEFETAATLYETALGVLDSTGAAAQQLLVIELERAETQRRTEVAGLERQLSDLRTRLSTQARDSAAAAQSYLAQIAVLEGAAREREETIAGLESDLEATRAELAAARRAVNEARLDYDETIGEQEETVVRQRQQIEDLEGSVANLEDSITDLETALESERAQLELLRSTLDAERLARTRQLEQSSARTTQAVAAVRDAADTLGGVEESLADEGAVLDLLTTRTLLRAVIDSPAIREQYPTLPQDVENYFEAYGNQRIEQGMRQGIAEASSAIEAIAARLEITIDTSEPGGSLAGYVDRVVQLTESSLSYASPER